jgi:hypothetical protein
MRSAFTKIYRSLRSVLLIFLVLCVLLLYVFTFWVPCCDFGIQTMIGSSFTSSCLQEGSWLINIICVCLQHYAYEFKAYLLILIAIKLLYSIKLRPIWRNVREYRKANQMFEINFVSHTSHTIMCTDTTIVLEHSFKYRTSIYYSLVTPSKSSYLYIDFAIYK